MAKGICKHKQSSMKGRKNQGLSRWFIEFNEGRRIEKDRNLHAFYLVWRAMVSRCNRKNQKSYDRYGGRGIKVADAWLRYETFKKDMLAGYAKGLTLERIDNNSGYCKENCRWATRKEQANNRNTSRIIEYQGTQKTLTEWIDYFGLKSSTVRQRFYVYGWSLERCFERKLNFG